MLVENKAARSRLHCGGGCLKPRGYVLAPGVGDSSGPGCAPASEAFAGGLNLVLLSATAAALASEAFAGGGDGVQATAVAGGGDGVRVLLSAAAAPEAFAGGGGGCGAAAATAEALVLIRLISSRISAISLRISSISLRRSSIFV